MTVGISVPLPAYTFDPAIITKKAEDLGFDSIWYAEHPAVPVKSVSPFPATGGEIPWTYSHFSDPYIALARASAVTSTIKLATGITLVPERNPLLLAKEISVLDLHSGGRFIFGIGTGWLKEETELMGGNFARRWTQAREALDVMKFAGHRKRRSITGNFLTSRRSVLSQNHSSNRAPRSISAVPRRKSWNASSRTPTAGCRTGSHPKNSPRNARSSTRSHRMPVEILRRSASRCMASPQTKPYLTPFTKPAPSASSCAPNGSKPTTRCAPSWKRSPRQSCSFPHPSASSG